MMDDEITPTLRMPLGTDLTDYKDALIARFRNPALKHRTWQIAMDGSQKLPQRLLGTIRDRLAIGAPIHRLCARRRRLDALRALRNTTRPGSPSTSAIPLAARLARHCRPAPAPWPRGSSPELSWLMPEIFGPDRPADPAFRWPGDSASRGAFRSRVPNGHVARMRRRLSERRRINRRSSR